MDSVDIVHNGIPLDVFKPLPKKRQIAYMSRRRPAEIENSFRVIAVFVVLQLSFNRICNFVCIYNP